MIASKINPKIAVCTATAANDVAQPPFPLNTWANILHSFLGGTVINTPGLNTKNNIDPINAYQYTVNILLQMVKKKKILIYNLDK